MGNSKETVTEATAPPGKVWRTSSRGSETTAAIQYFRRLSGLPRRDGAPPRNDEEKNVITQKTEQGPLALSYPADYV